MIYAKRTRKAILERIIPPLWLWLRLIAFLSASGFFALIELYSIARILAVLAIAGFLGSALAVVFQEVANGIKRVIGNKNVKKNKNSV